MPSINNLQKQQKTNTAFIWILSKHYLSTFFFFFFLCRSLYFSFNTSLMPQWIKIQSLLEINNTQNIQRILECFTVTSSRLPVAVHEPTRGLRPHPNHIHNCLLVPLIPTLTFSHLVWRPRPGKESSESIRMPPRLTCVACYDAVPLHTSWGRNRGKVSIQHSLWLQIKRYVQRRRELLFCCLLALFSTIYFDITRKYMIHFFFFFQNKD